MNKILLVYDDYTELMSVESALKRVGFDVIGLSSEYAVAKQVVSFNPELVIASGSSGKVNSLSVGKRLKDMSRWQGKALLIFSPQLKPTALELIKIRADMILEAPILVPRLLQILAKVLGHEEAVLLERLKRPGVESTPKSFNTVISQGPALGEDSFYIRGKNIPESENRKSSFNIEPQGSDEISNEPLAKKTFDFRIGSRVTNADKEEKIESKDGIFPDVDLLGGKPADTEISVVYDSESEEKSVPAAPEFEKAQRDLKQRVAKYQSLVENVSVPAQSTMSRIETRKRQKKLTEDWNKQEIVELDELRRQFTKALFKK